MEKLEPQWDRLAYYVTAFRSTRGMSQKAVSANGGPSDTTLSKIETGEWRPTRGVDQTLEKLDAGLGWQPGSASQVLAGGEPVYRVTAETLGRTFPRYDDRRIAVVDTEPLRRYLEAWTKPADDRTPEDVAVIEQMRHRLSVRGHDSANTEAADRNVAQILVALAIDADEVDSAAAHLDARELDDDVESLLIEVDRLTQRIHDEAVAAVGGDIETLRRLKSDAIRERRSRRRELRIGRRDGDNPNPELL